MCTKQNSSSETYKVLWNFDIHTDHPNSARRQDLFIINKREKEKLSNSGLCHPGWPHSENKTGKRDKYLDLVGELKKLWNSRVMVIPIVTIPKGLVKRLEVLEIRGRVETIQATALLRAARILRRVLETWIDLLSLPFVRYSVPFLKWTGE